VAGWVPESRIHGEEALSSMSLTAIVPVWNGRAFLAVLLRSLEAQTRRADEILVVDNGSTDGADQLARAHGARVITMGRNAGFAAAVNRGIRESQSEWVAVLNSDVDLAPDYFERLLSAGALFATGKILSARTRDRIDATFDAVCRGGVAWRVGNGRVDAPVFAAPRQIWSAPWTAALFSVDVFARVGLLEEAFESYLEDVEFGMRCAAAGICGRYVPEAVAWHYGSAALGRWHPETVRRIARNQCFLVALHYPRSLLFRNAWAIFVAHLLWGFVAARHGTGWAWICGKWEGLRKVRNMPREMARTRLGIGDFLSANERVIRDVQASTGSDFYWRLYFLLTGGGAK
jgi:GT2 family glycosyltransferase